MNRERRARADALLAEALDLPESERAAFLLEVCGDDPAMLRLITELLQGAESPDGFLRAGEVFEGPLWERASAELHGPDVVPGTIFGAWEVVGELGAGGMAEVFLARRVAGDFEQTAALKLIKRGVDTDEVVRRFRQERQILASLEHPNIARLLDGGVSPDGRPFFVMERIDGLPIDDRCNRDGASIDTRLRRFLDICRAVEHAHRKLVVHRDLKPSNILIDASGQVKLLDFGIAKLLDPMAGIEPAPATRTSARVMTPEYASPEQVRGEPATTASDVYQLGLILYELLTGHRAHDLRDASLTEIERIVCEQMPARPSTAVGRRETGGPRAAAPAAAPARRPRQHRAQGAAQGTGRTVPVGDGADRRRGATPRRPSRRRPAADARVSRRTVRAASRGRRRGLRSRPRILDRRARVHVLAGADRPGRARQRAPRGRHG